MKIVQGERKRFVKKEVTTEILEAAAKTNSVAVAEAKHLQVRNKIGSALLVSCLLSLQP